MRVKLLRIVLGLVLAVLVGAWTLGQEEPGGEPMGVIPTPSQPGGLWIKLELPDGRSAYALGEHVRLGFTINQKAYVYIFNIPPSMQVINIFPNEFTDLRNPLEPRQDETGKYIPYILPDNDRYHLEVTEIGGLGLEYFGAIASKEPLPLFEARARVLGAILAEDPSSFQSETSAAIQGVEPVPNQDTLKKFNIAVITIRTFREPAAVPEQASLLIKSTPPARLLLDGRELGYTLADEFRRIPVSVGQHLVELRREGYQPYSKVITLSRGEERILDVTLNHLPLPYFRYTPRRPHVGEEVRFSAVESEDPDGIIAKYEWDFESDGKVDAKGFLTRHIFPRSGTYNVTLIVTDDKGAKNQLTKPIQVR